MVTKKDIRKDILVKRMEMEPCEVFRKSGMILERLRTLDICKKSRIVMCYVDYKNEVMTRELITFFLSYGKKVSIPAVIEKSDKSGNSILIMEASEIADIDNELETGHYGIPEPKKEFLRILNPEMLDMVIVPGICFGRDRSRIGYGKGYYDRYLKRVRDNCIKIGLAYDFQVLDDIPTSGNDIRMDMIVTESGIIS